MSCHAGVPPLPAECHAQVQGSPPWGQGGSDLSLEELDPFREGQGWRQAAQFTALGGADFVSGALEVLLEVKGMQPWMQHKEVVSHTTVSTKGVHSSDYRTLSWAVCRQKPDGQG